MVRWEPDYFPTLNELERRLGVPVFPSSFASTAQTRSGREREFLDWIRRLQRELGEASERLRVETAAAGHEYGTWAVTLLAPEAAEVDSEWLPAQRSGTG